MSRRACWVVSLVLNAGGVVIALLLPISYQSVSTDTVLQSMEE